MKYLFFIAALIISGCISESEQESILEEDEVSNDQNLRPDSSYLEDSTDPQGCDNHFSYHKLVFDNKEYLISLPIACNQAPYIEMGYPSDYKKEFANSKWNDYTSVGNALIATY